MKTIPESTVQEDLYTPHRELFDKWAPNYDGCFLQWGAFTPVHNIIIEHLGEIPPASKFLDVACGTGNLALRLAEIAPGGKVVGLDFSPEMIALARAKTPVEGANVEFIKGNAEVLPFPDDSFDFVSCSCAFHHFPHSEKAVREMYRVLKDGGRAFMVDVYKNIPWGIVILWFNSKFIEKGAQHYYPKTLRDFFRESGFEKIEQKRSFKRLLFFHPTVLTMGTARK